MLLKNRTAILLFAKIIIFFFLAQKTCGQDFCDSGGICIEAEKCPSAAHQIYINKSHKLERCGWNKLSELVCCLDNLTDPGLTDGGIHIITSSTESVISTTKKNEPRGTVRKCEEACARYSTLVPSNINYFISNGENASPGEFPHMAALGFLNPDGGDELQWVCGASLISERHLITAAHCLISRLSRPVRALLGVLNKTEQSASRREYSLENITIHPEYNRRRHVNDIAIITIEGSVSFGDLVYPACLYTRSDDPLGLIITGWGKLFLGQDTLAETLQKARVVPVELSTCNETYIRRLNLTLVESQICAGSPNPLLPQDSCPGDSGGPMQFLSGEDNMYKLVGVISFGITDCGGTDPSIYARVYAYIDWIESVVWPS